MTQDAHDLLQKALSLSESERAELAGNLISSLESTVDENVEAAWQEEVVRRQREIQSEQVTMIPWEEVQKKARALLHDKQAAPIPSARGTGISDGAGLVSKAEPDSRPKL